jgi:hypothetical protein
MVVDLASRNTGPVAEVGIPCLAGLVVLVPTRAEVDRTFVASHNLVLEGRSRIPSVNHKRRAEPLVIHMHQVVPSVAYLLPVAV